MSVIRPAAPLNEGQHVTSNLPEAPTITVELANGGRRLTCPAGHTFWHLGRAMPEILAPWVVDHEGHVVDDPDDMVWGAP
jgi:hypothetical protein